MFCCRTLRLLLGFCSLASASVIVEPPQRPGVVQYIFERTGNGACSLVFKRNVDQFRLLTSTDDVVAQVFPKHRTYGGPRSEESSIMVYGYTEKAVKDELEKHCSSFVSFGPDGTGRHLPKLVLQGENSYSPQDAQTFPLPPTFPNPPDMEITPLYISGPNLNRADFVFFGDGYTLEEKDKFLSDAKRLAGDLVTNHTFATVSALINIWAAFSPSNESGVGTGGKPKDTVYGLYRDGTELRAVYPKNEIMVHAACAKLGSQCDYPILLGNDPLYGGLGGLVTVTTSSQENGALVLRHELGHSVILAGDEYDGAHEYSGVNVDNSLDIKWRQWLASVDTPMRAERSVMPLQGYPWTILNDVEPYSAPFTSSGTFSRYLVRFSLSGIPRSDDLKVLLDGEDLGWEARSGIGIDRWHYDIHRDTPLGGGDHLLEFALQPSGNVSIAQLCSFEILEFGNENEFNTTVGHIGAYPTFSSANKTTYRPTNEECLMRDVTSPNFCSPCTEGLWRSLFSRINIVDTFGGGCHPPDEHSDQYHWNMEMNLLPLAQFRNLSLSGATSINESFSITYTRLEDGKPYPELQNSTSFITNDSDVGVWYQADLQFHTDEVKSDPDNLLTSSWYFVTINYCKDIMEPEFIVTQNYSEVASLVFPKL